MPDVVTPLSRNQLAEAAPSVNAPRHRRDGQFDEADQWHDAAERKASNG